MEVKSEEPRSSSPPLGVKMEEPSSSALSSFRTRLQSRVARSGRADVKPPVGAKRPRSESVCEEGNAKRQAKLEQSVLEEGVVDVDSEVAASVKEEGDTTCCSGCLRVPRIDKTYYAEDRQNLSFQLSQIHCAAAQASSAQQCPHVWIPTEMRFNTNAAYNTHKNKLAELVNPSPSFGSLRAAVKLVRPWIAKLFLEAQLHRHRVWASCFGSL